MIGRKAPRTSRTMEPMCVVRQSKLRRQMDVFADHAHIYFLLDRSGSMQAIADDVIKGFNAFVKEQQVNCNDSAGLDMTLVQFDSKNAHEICFAALGIDDVPLL